jgi:hypothetical protein
VIAAGCRPGRPAEPAAGLMPARLDGWGFARCSLVPAPRVSMLTRNDKRIRRTLGARRRRVTSAGEILRLCPFLAGTLFLTFGILS